MKRNLLAYILIAVGILTLLGNYGFIEGDFFLLIVGAAFLAVYFRNSEGKKNIGFLIPGIMVTTVGLFSNVESYLFGFDGPIFIAMIGGAFILINYIHSRQIGSSSETKWAHYVGLGIILFAVFVFAVDNLNFTPINLVFENIVPIALIVFGLYKLSGGKKKKTL